MGDIAHEEYIFCRDCTRFYKILVPHYHIGSVDRVKWYGKYIAKIDDDDGCIYETIEDIVFYTNELGEVILLDVIEEENTTNLLQVYLNKELVYEKEELKKQLHELQSKNEIK